MKKIRTSIFTAALAVFAASSLSALGNLDGDAAAALESLTGNSIRRSGQTPIAGERVAQVGGPIASGDATQSLVSTPLVIARVFRELEQGLRAKGVPNPRWAWTGAAFAQNFKSYYESLNPAEERVLNPARQDPHIRVAFDPDGKVNGTDGKSGPNGLLANPFPGKTDLDGKPLTFGIRLGEVRPPAIAVAVVMGYVGSWEPNPDPERPNKAQVMSVNKTSVAGALIRNPAGIVESGGPDPVIRLRADDKFTGGKLDVYLMRLRKDLDANDPAAAVKEAKKVTVSNRPFINPKTGRPYKEVLFPQAKFEKQYQLTDLENMGVLGTNWYIVQFLLEQKLSLDHRGIVALAAGAASMRRRSAEEAPSPDMYPLDGSYLAWIEVAGAVHYAALISQQSMLEPDR